MPVEQLVGCRWNKRSDAVEYAMEGFAELPGVTTRKITDDDADQNHGVLLVQASDAQLE